MHGRPCGGLGGEQIASLDARDDIERKMLRKVA